MSSTTCGGPHTGLLGPTKSGSTLVTILLGFTTVTPTRVPLSGDLTPTNDSFTSAAVNGSKMSLRGFVLRLHEDLPNKKLLSVSMTGD